ncbi:MAG: transposase family protein, partial [Patescibacteria group bacterium]
GLKASERGRPYASLEPETRDAATALLNHVGPEASFLFLRETFPAAPREALLDLHTEFRLEDQRDDRALDQYLRWTRPGTVWGMDFHGPFAPIDGIFPNIFLSKDLSSHALISGLPTETQTSIEVEGILSPLFSVNGRPLVLKTDNGSGFISKETRAFLEKQRVLLLLSPGYQPAYNGGAEGGVPPVGGNSEVKTTS